MVSGVIEDGSGTVNILKQGAGVWTLVNANTYAGATTINAGTLKPENSLTPTVTIGATGRLDLSDNKLVTNSPAGTFIAGAYSGKGRLSGWKQAVGAWLPFVAARADNVPYTLRQFDARRTCTSFLAAGGKSQ